MTGLINTLWTTPIETALKAESLQYRVEKDQDYGPCCRRQNPWGYSKALRCKSRQVAVTTQRRKGWREVEDGRHGVVEYVVRQERRCMSNRDKAGVVQTYFDRLHRLQLQLD